MIIKYPIKTIFLGTPAFAVPAFEVLIQDRRFEVIAAYTQPDKPVGRKQVLLATAVKICAQKHDLPVYQPKNINAELTVEQIQSMRPDLMVVAAYGAILSKPVLDIPKMGCINIHASLLPRWRGASPIASAILNGDKKTGISFMLMDEKLDHGPVLKQVEIDISMQDTAETLKTRLGQLGADNLIQTLIDYNEGAITPLSQDESSATFCKTLKKQDAKIDWQNSAEQIERQVRAFNPWPGTYCGWNGKRLKINQSEIGPDQPQVFPGKTNKIDEQVLVGTGHGNLLIKELQVEGKKPMNVTEFLNGYPDFADTHLQ